MMRRIFEYSTPEWFSKMHQFLLSSTVFLLFGLLAGCVLIPTPSPILSEPSHMEARTARSAYSVTPTPNFHILGPNPTALVTHTLPADVILLPTISTLRTISTTSQIHSMQVIGYYPVNFAIDDEFIYWTGGPDARLYRFPISGGENQILASSQFNQNNDGYLFSEWLVRTGDWLIFMDTQVNDIGAWALRALNVKTKQDKIIMQQTNPNTTWSPLPLYSADGDWLAWSRLELGNPAACDQSILGITNLATGEQRELDRVCTANNYMWGAPLLSSNYLVVEQDLPDNQGNKNNIYLWDWENNKRTALTTNGYSSSPAFSGKWIIWKNAPRYTASRDYTIYDLNTDKQRLFTIPKGCPSNVWIENNWLYTPPCRNQLIAYDLEREQMVNIIQLAKGERFRGTGLSSKWAVWGINRDSPNKHVLTEFQWRRLP